MKNRIAAAAATMTCVLMTLAIANAPARAYSPDPAPAVSRSVKIPTAGMDLGSADAQALLKRRIRSAASIVCTSRDFQPLRMAAKSRQCFHATVADGLKQMDRITAARTSSARYASLSRPDATTK